MMDANTFVEILDRVPAIILAVATLVGVVKGSSILTQSNEIKVEANRLKAEELRAK